MVICCEELEILLFAGVRHTEVSEYFKNIFNKKKLKAISANHSTETTKQKHIKYSKWIKKGWVLLFKSGIYNKLILPCQLISEIDFTI